MLIEFTVGNFLSFKEPVTISMVSANPVKELQETNTFIESTGKFKLLKTAAVYGNNASGKSNLVSSMTYMKRFVLSSFKYSLNDEINQKLEVTNFLLDEKYEKLPTLFEIVFVYNNKRFRYGFEILNGNIKSEWLFFVNSTKEIELFTRNLGIIKYNIRSFKEGKDLQEKTKDNVLFLSVCAQFNGDISDQVINWFKKLKLVSGLKDHYYQSYTIKQFTENEEFSNWASKIVSFLNINNIVSEEISNQITQQDKLELQNKDIKELFTILNRITEKNNSKTMKLFTLHKKKSLNDEVLDITFDLERQESEGTKKLLYLLGPIYDVLKHGSILVIDELDSRLHPLLTIKILELFSIHNPNNAQMIFTSHDTNLLRNSIFRRDQIWFTEKEDDGSTDLYSLVEYKNFRARKDASFNKDYLNGKYGAIPVFSDLDEIMDLIYG